MPYKSGISCVYTIINSINNKMYVGYTKEFLRNKNQHLNRLRKGIHDNRYLQEDFNTFGEVFNIEILEECPIIIGHSLEHYWSTTLNTHDLEFGYNIKPTHPDNKVGRIKGYHTTEETKRKISNGNKGVKRNFSIEWRIKNGIEARERLSKAVIAINKITHEFLGEFTSITECATYLKTDIKSISNALHKKKQKSVKGYIIFLKSEYYERREKGETSIS